LQFAPEIAPIRGATRAEVLSITVFRADTEGGVFEMPSPQDLLREYVDLNKRRVSAGITLLEYQRWLDLGQQLAKTFPDHPPLGQRGETRIVVGFKDREHLEKAVMMNMRPVGLFVNTPFAPDRGTELDLRVHVEETGEVFNSRVVVVSINVGVGFSTAVHGIGLKFCRPDCELRAVLDELCGVNGSEPDAEPPE
jgi:Tfp pilus assembly protein PilZ